MAEGYLRSLCEKAGNKNITVSSAGTFAGEGQPASEFSLQVMKKLGIDISGHRSSKLDAGKIEKADLIVTMTDAHRNHVGAINSSALKKTKKIMEFAEKPDEEIPDPFGGDAIVYDTCFEEMKDALGNLFLYLNKKTSSKVS